MPRPDHPPDDTLALLALTRTTGVGPKRMAALLSLFGSAPAAVASGRRGAWRALPGWDGGAARAAGLAVDVAAAAEEWRRGQRIGARCIVVGDADFPRSWSLSGGFPAALWVRGAWPAAVVAERPAAIAIVGSRRASDEALAFARATAEEAAWVGAWVVSGLAFGVDAAAHAGAIAAARAGASAGTIAVLPGGVDRATPSAHRALARAIVDTGGALLATAAIGASPAPGAFPIRNRWIAGLASSVAVIEAGVKSGALHTAAAALEFGREVATTPARPWDDHAGGSLALLRDGATPLLTPEDGWRTLPAGVSTVRERPPGGRAPQAPEPWATLLANGPLDPNDAIRAYGGAPGGAIAALERGALEGWLRRTRDGRYALSAAPAANAAPRMDTLGDSG